MPIAAGVLGIIGGVWSLTMWIIALRGALSWEPGIVLFVITLILCVMGIVGAGLAFRRARAGGTLMLMAGIAMLILIILIEWERTIDFIYMALPIGLLMAGGILGLVARR